MAIDNEKQYDKAFPLFKKYVDKHKNDNNKGKTYAWAILYLGMYHQQGLGVEKNARLAMPYLQEASTIKVDNGEWINDMAKYYMALIYHDGEGGITKDINKAYALMEVAAERVNLAQITLGQWLYYDNPANYAKAVRYLSMARKSTYQATSANACYLLSVCYRNGRGVTQDIKKADDLWQEALDKGWCETQTINDLIKEQQSLY